MGKAVFEGCRGLTALTLPRGIQHIGAGTFHKCTGLHWIHLPEGFPFDLHWFVNPHDPECRSADHSTIPFVTTRGFADIKSNMGQLYAGLGYILAEIAGVETAADIAAGYLNHIKNNLEQYLTELLTDVVILQWMVENGMIGQENIEWLLDKAVTGGHTAASAALLDYQNKSFSPKDQENLMDQRFEQFENALSL